MLRRLRKPGTSSAWLLPPVLGIAALLRLWKLPGRGLIYWDEGKFCLEGLRLLGGLQALVGMHGNLAAGKTIGTAKPTHALLIAVSYAVLGVHDYSPLILDALCSTATIAVLYLLARRLYGPGTALLAAVLLAVSGYDVLYARSALSESDANLLFAAGVWLWIGAWERDDAGRWLPGRPHLVGRLPAAVFMGAAFTTNYRLAVYIAVVVALDLALLAKRRGAWAPAALVWACALMSVPLVWEVVDLMTRAYGYTLFQSEITHRPTSYLGEAAYQLHQGKQAAIRFDPAPYLEWYVLRQGWPMTLLLAGGLALAAVRRTPSLLIPALLVALPYAAYVFAPFIVPRNLDTAIPFGAMLGAATLVFAFEGISTPKQASAVALTGTAIILALAGGLLSWRLTAVRSGFASAATFLEQHRDDRAIVSNEVMMFYLRDSSSACDAAKIPRRVADLAALVHAPYGYAILDVYNTEGRRYLLKHGDRVARYLIAGTGSLGENLVASENGTPPGGQQDQHVDVYWLPDLHFQHGHSTRYPTCSLDRVA